MQWLKWLSIVYLVVAGKLALGASFTPPAFLPDPVAVVGVLTILTLNHPLAFAAAAGIGLVGDIYWNGPVGLWMFTLCNVGYWLGGIRKWFDLERPFRSAACAWVLAGAHYLLAGTIGRLWVGTPIDWEAACWQAVWRGLVCAVAVVGVEAALQAVQRRLRLIFQPASN